jgi:hypothetical protein
MEESKSIEQLENEVWKDVEFPTSLVQKCYAYRKLPIKDLTVEQVRLLLGQRIGVKYLLPKALNLLEKDILAEGDYYPGDLLVAVLGLEAQQWKGYEDGKKAFETLLQNRTDTLKSADAEELANKVQAFLENPMRTTSNF